MQQRLIFILLFSLFTTVVFSQQKKSKVGVKLGLNTFRFLGPTEALENETFSYSSGFEFSLNYTYYLTYFLGFRAELAYLQRGSNRTYVGDSYAIIKTFEGQHVEEGKGELTIDYSLGYVSFPFSVVVHPISKIELFGGVSFDLMVSPIGSGNYKFTSRDNPDKIFFRQSLEHKYKSDVAGFFNTLPGSISIILTGEDGEEENIAIPKSVGAYYYYDEEITDSFFNWFDIGLHAGASYYINPGLFLGLKVNYNLFDLTNQEFDNSQEKLNEDGSFITRNDNDTSFGFTAFFGFRF